MTPEVLSGADLKASTAQDIWALGILAFQLLTGKVPFDSETNNLKAIRSDIISKPVQFPSSTNLPYPEGAISLVKRMLDKNRITRLKMHEVMQDEWLFPENYFQYTAAAAT